MNQKKIFTFLHKVAIHNNREWFGAHKALYMEATAEFQSMAETLIERIGQFDSEVLSIPVKSTLYRFYRDTRFSADKSPYKRHFGTYINPRGKKSLHGGYYFHLEPGQCMVALGSYYLEPPVLHAVRNSILYDTERFLSIAEDAHFRQAFPNMSLSKLKTIPKGFPRDFAHPEYLKAKDYCIWTNISDEAVMSPNWADTVAQLFETGKPFLDFINETVDDYI